MENREWRIENGEWKSEGQRAPVFAFGYAVAGRTEVGKGQMSEDRDREGIEVGDQKGKGQKSRKDRD